MSYAEKIKKLEEEKQKLIAKRQKEILAIITDTGALDIDNKLLTGLLLFLKDPKNKDSTLLSEVIKSNKNNKNDKDHSATNRKDELAG